MSTMLATTNPEAVAEMDPGRDRRRPYVGQSVLFYARPGEGRQGKLVSPAIVIGVEDDDHVELLVIYAADDFIVRWKIARHSDQNPINSWSFNSYDEEYYQPDRAVELPVEKETGEQLTWEDVKQMYKELGELRARVGYLEGKIEPVPAVRIPKAAQTKGL